MAQFYSPDFQTFMKQEQEYYTDVYNRIDTHLLDQHTFTYQTVYSIFSHMSLLHNTQAKLTQHLMKMFGSMVREEKHKSPPIHNPLLELFNQTEQIKQVDPIISQPLKNDLTEQQSIVIESDKEKQESKKELFKKQFQKFIKKKRTTPADEHSTLRSKQPKLDGILQDNSKKKQHNNIDNNSVPLDRLFRDQIRTKKDRECVDGHFCEECAKFANNMSLDVDQLQFWKHNCSRHRTNNLRMQEKLLLTPES